MTNIRRISIMYMDGSFEIIKEFDPEIAQMTIAEEQRQLNTLCLM